MSDRVPFTFDGVSLEGRYGESLAAALMGAGYTDFRQTRTGHARSIFCGMGVCQDCLVNVDGKPNQRACMTKLEKSVSVESEIFGRPLPAVAEGQPFKLIDDVPEESPEVLVIGAGPGGLSAAIAARRSGARVVVADERPAPGGQYFKQVLVDGRDVAPPDRQHLEGRRLIETALKLGVEIRNNMDVWGAFGPNDLVATEAGFIRRFSPQRLVVATGAYERGVPVPGWTLPGVMTTGAAQTLWRSYRRLPGARILIAGNGPLNMQVASELKDGGAEIAGVVELAEMPLLKSISALSRMAAAAPRLVRDGLRYRSRLSDVPIVYGSAITRIAPSENGLTVQVSSYPDAGKTGTRTFEVDTVCLGYGFQPSNEILRALGCEHVFDSQRGQFVAVLDDKCRTSVENVYSLGDCTGLGGARVALSNGRIAGWAVAEDLGHAPPPSNELDQERRNLSRHQRFQAALWELYAAPRPKIDLASPDTIVCRCEEVTVSQIQDVLKSENPSIGDLKRATRAGMGSCQGRYCGPILSELVAASKGQPPDDSVRFAPRMPVKPVCIADIARIAKP
ncbi:MAG: FAD-dependent oxidoreductase [Rhizobiaceae bacterium]|nr:FAD-dependent oxidoreductase [Rhizobiaceae bacterium]